MIGRWFMVLCCIAFLASPIRVQGVDLVVVLAIVFWTFRVSTSRFSARLEQRLGSARRL